MADDKKPEQTTSDYDEWVASQAAKKQNDNSDEPDNDDSEETSDSIEEKIARAVQQALAKEREQVAAAAPQSLVPNHGGGIGVDNHQQSWSQYDQELAINGEHPLQKQ